MKKPVVGILEWFHQDAERIPQVIKDLKSLRVKYLRTGISWHEFNASEQKKFYDLLIPQLGTNFDLLPCLCYTPKSLGIKPSTSSPPKDTNSYSDFVGQVIKEYGKYFEFVELWNEPNNPTEWDMNRDLDQDYKIFSQMIDQAAKVAHQLGKKTVLGGMSPADPQWLERIIQNGGLKNIDVVGVHGFPGVWERSWNSWQEVIQMIQNVLDKNNLKIKIWITETGFAATLDNSKSQQTQVEAFQMSTTTPVERVYWYGLYDLKNSIPTVRESNTNGFARDQKEYQLGLKTENGIPKLLFKVWAEKN